MKTKLNILIAIVLSAMTFVSCDKDFNDSELWASVNSNTARIENLERLVAQINNDIASLNTMVNALQTNKVITHVSETSEGYAITFSDGTTISIRHGKNGTDGRDGKDAPVIGVRLHSDGVYYWTITIDGVTTWLTDDNGQKLRVSGIDGEDGVNGTNGTNGVNGADGKDGMDGITPKLRVDSEGYWEVSYDGGNTYEPVLDADGNRVKATSSDGEKGKDGEDGKDGITPKLRVDANGYWEISYDNGKSYVPVLDVNGMRVKAVGEDGKGDSQFFQNIYITEEYIEFTLLNGENFRLPVETRLYMTLSQSETISIQEGATVTIPFTVVGYTTYTKTFVEICVHGNLQASVEYNGAKDGKITITRTGGIDEDTKILVFLCNGLKTITYVLTFTDYVDERLPQVVPDDILINIRDHMPIYEGVNPPNVEGSYVMDPGRVVYCSDEGNGGWAPGYAQFAPVYFRFLNQDLKNNTLDYQEKEGSSTAEGKGAFISGSGDNFTAFFNTEGQSGGIYVKTALVISGTKTTSGIKDIYYSFVMVRKGADPNNKLMKEGVFRIFDDADGLASKASWSAPTQTRGELDGLLETVLSNSLSK